MQDCEYKFFEDSLTILNKHFLETNLLHTRRQTVKTLKDVHRD